MNSVLDRDRPSPTPRGVGSSRQRGTRRAGFTIIELVIVLTMVGLVATISLPRLRGLSNELENAARETGGFFRQTRAEAMTTTSAYRVISNSDRSLRAEFATGCSADDDDWTLDTSMPFELRERASFLDLASDSTLICFNSRGVGNANPVLTILRAGRTAEVEVFLGGGVTVTPFPAEDE